jgi:NitT/TauT family transport system ATP-binding protein
MENELLELWSADRKSVVFITHDSRRRSHCLTAWSCFRRAPPRIRSGSIRSIYRAPRDVAEIRLTPRFVELHREIWHRMKDEVMKGTCRVKAR